MKTWEDEDGVEFRNSDACWGREYNAETDTLNVAKIYIRGKYPETGWSYNQESHEIAVVVDGSGMIESKEHGRKSIGLGDVVYLEPMERFRWEGKLDIIVPCGPAFDPNKHIMETDDEV